MSADGENNTACPNFSEKSNVNISADSVLEHCEDVLCEKTSQKPPRKVTFPDEEDKLVTQYFEPANPWEHGKLLH